jgi:hypothetical protein
MIFQLVFPTPVGVFLRNRIIMAALVSLPHARGGVSGSVKEVGRKKKSSPLSMANNIEPVSAIKNEPLFQG